VRVATSCSRVNRTWPTVLHRRSRPPRHHHHHWHHRPPRRRHPRHHHHPHSTAAAHDAAATHDTATTRSTTATHDPTAAHNAIRCAADVQCSAGQWLQPRATITAVVASVAKCMVDRCIRLAVLSCDEWRHVHLRWLGLVSQQRAMHCPSDAPAARHLQILQHGV
jgi:hypothetical protein